MKLRIKILALLLLIMASGFALRADESIVTEDLALNIHLMHPGADSGPADPNAAIFVDGTYHMHYIIHHPWQEKRSYSFIHCTSKDMLNWIWEPTKLQPSFTGHGMFSGTAFMTKEGKPAIIYHGQGSGRNQLVVAKNNSLSEWNKPYSMDIKTADGEPAKVRHWDPDCFLIGDTYYAISGGAEQPLFKSKDLKNWTLVGPFLQSAMPDTIKGEDISCANFFQLGDKWVLLCISHMLGCRYYIGDWDAEAEHFIPEKHGRMNWRREDRDLAYQHRDFFAPESLLTPDGRRVMWAWLATLDDSINAKSIQSLPRELSLGNDGNLRIKPLRELQMLRQNPTTMNNVQIPAWRRNNTYGKKDKTNRLAQLKSDAMEILITVDRKEADRKRFGVLLFANGKNAGLPIIIRPETGTIRVGTTEAPFAVSDLPEKEDVKLQIFVDKYLVEVFVNDRQAVVASHMAWKKANGLLGYSFGEPTIFKKFETWQLSSTTQGFHNALKSPIWQPDSK